MPRPQHAVHPPISYPRASHSSISISPTSHSTSRSRKHSLTLTNPMGWLSRSNTQSSEKTHRKSDSKSTPRSIEILSERTGPLGSGATVVRTPEEALQDSRVCLTRYDSKGVDEMGQRSRPIQPPVSPVSDNLSLSLASPALLPLPASDGEYDSQELEDPFDLENDESLRPIGTSSPPRPTRACPPAPHEVSPRSSLKPQTPRSSTEDLSQIPPLPINATPSCPPQPEFQPILVSDLPSGPLDFSKVIITLETCTTTYRTTMETLTSRPSHLSAYIASLFPRQRSNSTASSIYSTNSVDLSVYRNHLASQGLLSRTPTNLHIFLDRPSAPYAHILSYLRSPDPEESGLPETLPRAVQLQPSYTQSRLEALLELRDEAVYLNLDGLSKLCVDEIRQRQLLVTPRLHSRNQSRSLQSSTNPGRISVQSQQASVHSFSLESTEVKSVLRSKRQDVSNTDSTSSTESHAATMGARSPPTPLSWRDARSSITSSRSRSRTRALQSPPAGWI